MSKKEKESIIKKIERKFKKIPNTGHLETWLQRLTLGIVSNIAYDEKLCRKVKDDKIELWCSDWLEKNIRKSINETEIVNQKKNENIGYYY